MSEMSDFASALAPLFDLQGKVAVVTGGATGMGRAAVRIMASAGATVIIADEEAHSIRAKEIAQAIGNRAEIGVVDVTSEASIAALFDDTGSKHGKLDILVNAVALNHNKPTLEISAAEWDHVQDVNLRSAFFTTKAGGAADATRWRWKNHQHHYHRRSAPGAERQCCLFGLQGRA